MESQIERLENLTMMQHDLEMLQRMSRDPFYSEYEVYFQAWVTLERAREEFPEEAELLFSLGEIVQDSEKAIVINHGIEALDGALTQGFVELCKRLAQQGLL